MIMLAKVVPYGGNAVRYALDKEKAKLVKVNYMPEGISITASCISRTEQSGESWNVSWCSL